MKPLRLNYDYISANDAGEERHAQTVMRELALKYNFEIIGAVSAPVGDCWVFQVTAERNSIAWPSFIREIEPDGTLRWNQ